MFRNSFDQSNVPHSALVRRTNRVTGLEATVHPGGSVRHDGLDLEELLLAVVAAHDGEAQSAVRLDQVRADALALQLGRVAREERPAVAYAFNTNEGSDKIKFTAKTGPDRQQGRRNGETEENGREATTPNVSETEELPF